MPQSIAGACQFRGYALVLCAQPHSCVHDIAAVNIPVTEERLSALAEEDITVEELTEPTDRVESLGQASKFKCP